MQHECCQLRQSNIQKPPTRVTPRLRSSDFRPTRVQATPVPEGPLPRGKDPLPMTEHATIPVNDPHYQWNAGFDNMVVANHGQSLGTNSGTVQEESDEVLLPAISVGRDRPTSAETNNLIRSGLELVGNNAPFAECEWNYSNTMDVMGCSIGISNWP